MTQRKGVPMAMLEARLRQILEDGDSLLIAAEACKQGGFDPVGCANQMYRTFPQTLANDMAAVIVTVWGAETSADVLVRALGECRTPQGTAAYTQAQIEAAVSASLSLQWLDFAMIGGTRMNEIGLFQGDLTAMKPAETVQVLAISVLPGDYAPTPGSMLAALAAKGVSVAQLSQNKAADYRTQYGCWISQPIASQAFGQILCFESTGANAPAGIPDIYTALQTFFTSPPANFTLASAMLSTGSAGADPSAVLTALFNGAKTAMTGAFGALSTVKIVNYTAAWTPSLQQRFAQLKA